MSFETYFVLFFLRKIKFIVIFDIYQNSLVAQSDQNIF